MDLGQTILPAFSYENQLCVWCYHCNRLHFHGLSDEASHKVAHCGGTDGPYVKAGYVIVPIGKIDDAKKTEKKLQEATKQRLGPYGRKAKKRG